MGIVFEVMGHPQLSITIVQVLNSPSLYNEAGNTVSHHALQGINNLP